jgi:hypothetical protein
MDNGMTSIRRRLLKRWTALKLERSTFLEHWRELSEYLQPRRGRFLSSDRNKGGKKNDRMINGTPIYAIRVLASGMMAGITSKARPWFRLTSIDPALSEQGSVKMWLAEVEDRMRETLAKSNLYRCFHNVYEDLAQFGTSAMYVEEDEEDVIRGYVFPVGMYCLTVDARGRANGIWRELGMTVGQLVEKFGLDACSDSVKRLHAAGDLDAWIDVLHVIYPNPDHKPGTIGPKGKPWVSAWLEINGGDFSGTLKESGFDRFPVMAPRWSTNGEDIYGRSPGMDALGDAKALQQIERRQAMVVDKITNPPMNAPTSMMNSKISLVPGATNYVDSTAQNTLRPVYEIRADAVTVLDNKIRLTEGRLSRAFFADLWLMMTQGDDTQKTAREIAERHEEKMMQLGPVLEQLQDELLDPLIDTVFRILLSRGMIPPPPPELEGTDIKVEHISILAQAQKLLGITGVERLAGFTVNLSKAMPSVLDKLDLDEMVDDMGDRLGVSPDLVRPDDVVAKIRQARAQAQQQQAQAEAQLRSAQTAKTLSETETGGDNGLTRMASMMGTSVPG